MTRAAHVIPTLPPPPPHSVICCAAKLSRSSLSLGAAIFPAQRPRFYSAFAWIYLNQWFLYNKAGSTCSLLSGMNRLLEQGALQFQKGSGLAWL